MYNPKNSTSSIFILILFFIALTSFTFLVNTSKSVDLKGLSKSWTTLERDSIGYLIYKPCNGTTPKILINNDTLIVVWQLESEKHLISKVEKISESRYKLKCFGAITNEGLLAEPFYDFEIKVIDSKKKIYLWNWISYYVSNVGLRDTTTWLMTPSVNSKTFRQVGNPCPYEMKREKTFLPIDKKLMNR